MRTAYRNMAYSWEQRFCSKQQKSHSDWIWTKFGEEKEEIPQTYIHNKSLIEAIELEQMFAIEWFRYFTSFATNFSSFYGHNSVSNSIFSLCVLNIKNNSSHLILLSYICFWNSSGFIAVIVIVVTIENIEFLLIPMLLLSSSSPSLSSSSSTSPPEYGFHYCCCWCCSTFWLLSCSHFICFW